MKSEELITIHKREINNHSEKLSYSRVIREMKGKILKKKKKGYRQGEGNREFYLTLIYECNIDKRKEMKIL